MAFKEALEWFKGKRSMTNIIPQAPFKTQQVRIAEPVAWYCPVCGKFDLAGAEQPMAKPEHVPYRGIDIGSCKGDMIPLYDGCNCPYNAGDKC